MNKNQSQLQWVVDQLKKNGFVTRNQCLHNYISRLGSIIWKLKKKGFEFDAYFQENKTLFGTEQDYIYKWTNRKEETEVKFDFVFFWIDEDNTETPLKISARSFSEACEIFLTQPPIFLFAVSEEVEDNSGMTHRIDQNQKFSDFRTYSKPKKRTK